MDGGRRPRWRSVGIGAAVAAAAALALAACSSSHTASGSAAPDQPVSLQLAVASPAPSYGDLFWAIQQGIFTKLGLNLTLNTGLGGNAVSEVASGQIVAAVNGTTQSLGVMLAGRSIQFIAADTNGVAASAVTVLQSSDYKDLMDLSGQTVGVIGVNGSAWGCANSDSDYIVAHGGKALKIVVGANAAAEAAALQSGSTQAIIGNPAYSSQIKAGQFRELMSIGDPLQVKITGGHNVIATSYYGSPATLKKNKTAITRLIAGLRIARAQIETAGDKKVADVLAGNSNFAPTVISSADLLAQVTAARPFWAGQDVQITKAQWTDSIAAFKKWNLLDNSNKPVDLTSPTISYAKAVNMAYWNDATALVKGYK